MCRNGDFYEEVFERPNQNQQRPILQVPQQTKGGHLMKMLLTVEFPLEPFNSLVRSGRAGEIIGRILETIKPETAYFTEQEGKRGGIFVIDVQNPSEIPFFSEPFFLNFQANCKFRILMSPADLQKAGLDDLGRKWA